MSRGLVHVYTGEGKGKTTASIGLLIRFLGSGKKALFIQFLKNSYTSEMNILSSLNGLEILRGKASNVFSFSMTQEEKNLSRVIHNNNLKEGIERVIHNDVGMLVLDEIIGAYNKNLVDKSLLLDFLDNKPENLEVVLTGRGADEEILKRADYVSYIKKVKHPYDIGIGARVGIER